MDTLIANVTAVTMNPKMEVLFGAYIGIDGGKIVSLSKTAPKLPTENPSALSIHSLCSRIPEMPCTDGKRGVHSQFQEVIL